MENNNILNKNFELLSPTIRKPQQKRKYTYQKKKQRFIPKVTYSNLLKESSLVSIKKQQCSLKCLNKTNDQDIFILRRQYLPKKEIQKNEWIQNYLQNNHILTLDCETTRWHIGGTDVCKSFWMLA